MTVLYDVIIPYKVWLTYRNDHLSGLRLTASVWCVVHIVYHHQGENGKFAKTIFYFLCADPYGKCKITVTGKAVNLGDGNGMQVPCILQLSGQKSMVEILKQQKMSYRVKIFVKKRTLKRTFYFTVNVVFLPFFLLI